MAVTIMEPIAITPQIAYRKISDGHLALLYVVETVRVRR
jgi:hypothetical protein